MAAIRSVTLRRLALPLIRPYRLSYRTFDVFEPYVVEIEDADGRTGIADGHISPGSSSETREGGWAFLREVIASAIGAEPAEAKAAALARFEESKVATTAFCCAVEVLEGSPFLAIPAETRLPLLTPVNATEPGAIAAEIEGWLGQGFAAFKVKVGKDVAADGVRVRAIQDAVAGRATLRLDANRAFSRADAVAFAAGLDPAGIELFEQPCDADDWDANAAVAAASPVPLMLDEPICTLADIARAADVPNVGFCKLKLKRFGSMERLHEGLVAVSDNGMEPVLGDGLGSELHAFLEAAVARDTIRNAGEFNGFLKPKERQFVEPMRFEDGAIVLPAGFRPTLDRAALERATTATETFS
jgi:L-Ala-D/L-Glu epimerase